MAIHFFFILAFLCPSDVCTLRHNEQGTELYAMREFFQATYPQYAFKASRITEICFIYEYLTCRLNRYDSDFSAFVIENLGVEDYSGEEISSAIRRRLVRRFQAEVVLPEETRVSDGNL